MENDTSANNLDGMTRFAEVCDERKRRWGLASDKEVSLRAGVPYGALTKWLVRGCSAKGLPIMATFFQVKEADLRETARGTPVPEPRQDTEIENPVSRTSGIGIPTGNLPDMALGVRDVAIIAARQAREGNVDFTAETIDSSLPEKAPRPAGLTGRDVKAVYMRGDTMSPWRESGDLIYVSTNRPPAIGCHVVVFTKQPDGKLGGVARKLVACDDEGLTLAQYKPPLETRIPASEVEAILRAAELPEMIGFP